MIHQVRTLSLFVVLAVFSTPAEAQVIVNIAPGGGNVVWTVEWSSLAGVGTPPGAAFEWDSMDPATGAATMTAPWGDIPQVAWTDVGNPFGNTYASGSLRGFGNGFDGVVSNPAGWGVGPDDNGGVNDDDLWIFNTNGFPIPATGMFTLTVPGANIDKYNVGVYTNNANVTVTVVPEPSAFLFLGLAGVGTVAWRCRRGAIA